MEGDAPEIALYNSVSCIPQFRLEVEVVPPPLPKKKKNPKIGHVHDKSKL